MYIHTRTHRGRSREEEAGGEIGTASLIELNIQTLKLLVKVKTVDNKLSHFPPKSVHLKA